MERVTPFITRVRDWAAAKSWLEALLGFFYPPVCQLCEGERATAADGFVGRACRHGIRWIHAPMCERCGLPVAGSVSVAFECSNCRGLRLGFERARAAVVADGVVLDVIRRFKYRRALWFEPFLAELLVSAAAPQLGCGDWDVIVPVPLHPVKCRERGFNQAERLAVQLSKATGVPLGQDWLRRINYTDTQTQFGRGQRSRNVQAAFGARREAVVKGSRVILVDDILTTGSTASVCAKALKRSGVRRVCVWTVARGV